MKAEIVGTLVRIAVIVLLGAVLGIAGNDASPRGLRLFGAVSKRAATAPGMVSLDEAKTLWGDGATLFLDARDPADYEAGHIGNALNLPAQSFGEHFGSIVTLVAPDTRMVVYCDGMECDLSHRLRKNLAELGYTNGRVLANGWTAWRSAGFATATGGGR